LGYRSFDYPDAIATFAQNINDAGMLVGYFVGADGLPHGFSYKQGSWMRIDYPGSTDTIVYGINNYGDMVGGFDLTQPITRGFILRNGIFETADTSLGSQSLVRATNDFGVSTGYSWTDPFTGPYLGFVRQGTNLQQFNFPDAWNTYPYSINTAADLCGVFQDPGSSFGLGFITVQGHSHWLYPFIYGSNDKGEIVGAGYLFDQTTGDFRFKTFVGHLPLASP
jgi:hypothetical protein